MSTISGQRIRGITHIPSTKRKDCGKGTREGLRGHHKYVTHPLQTPNGKSWEQVPGRNDPSPEHIH